MSCTGVRSLARAAKERFLDLQTSTVGLKTQGRMKKTANIIAWMGF